MRTRSSASREYRGNVYVSWDFPPAVSEEVLYSVSRLLSLQNKSIFRLPALESLRVTWGDDGTGSLNEQLGCEKKGWHLEGRQRSQRVFRFLLIPTYPSIYWVLVVFSTTPASMRESYSSPGFPILRPIVLERFIREKRSAPFAKGPFSEIF